MYSIKMVSYIIVDDNYIKHPIYLHNKIDCFEDMLVFSTGEREICLSIYNTDLIRFIYRIIYRIIDSM